MRIIGWAKSASMRIFLDSLKFSCYRLTIDEVEGACKIAICGKNQKQ